MKENIIPNTLLDLVEQVQGDFDNSGMAAVQAFLQKHPKPAVINYRRTQGKQNTALTLAIEKNNLPLATLLLRHNANIMQTINIGTPLHIAVRKNNLAMVILLLQAGANSQFITSKNKTIEAFLRYADNTRARVFPIDKIAVLFEKKDLFTRLRTWLKPRLQSTFLEIPDNFHDVLKKQLDGIRDSGRIPSRTELVHLLDDLKMRFGTQMSAEMKQQCEFLQTITLGQSKERLTTVFQNPIPERLQLWCEKKPYHATLLPTINPNESQLVVTLIDSEHLKPLFNIQNLYVASEYLKVLQNNVISRFLGDCTVEIQPHCLILRGKETALTEIQNHLSEAHHGQIEKASFLPLGWTRFAMSNRTNSTFSTPQVSFSQSP